MSAVSGIVYLLGRESPYLPPVSSLNEDIPPANISSSPRLAPRRRHDRVSESLNSSPPLHNNDHLNESRPNLPKPDNKMPGSDRDRNTYTTMPNNANERTHLLGQGNRNAREGKHAIFLRVCHSPWSGITQKLLTFIRGLLAIYLIVTFILVMIWQSQEKDHKGEGGEGKNSTPMASTTLTREAVNPLDEEMVGQFFKITFANAKKNETSDDDGRGGDSDGLPDGGWISIYRFETISLFIQMVYAVITLSWTLMHLISPRRQDTGIDSFGTKVKKFFSHPTGECAFLFSLFYVMAVSFPHVVVLVYWTIIVPARDIDVNDLFDHSQLQTFAVLNLYFFGSIIAFFELFFLSSVRRPGPSYSHILGLTTFAVAYFLYAYVGHYFTGKWVYYFLNYNKEGFENVFVALLAFISLLNIFYGFIYGLTGIREAVVDGEEGHGYQRVRGVDGGNDDEEGQEYDQYRDRDDTE